MFLKYGEFDAVQGLPYASLSLFQGKDTYKISQTETSRVYQIAFNYRTPALQDLRVRKAIAMAIDKENFTKVLLHGQGTPAAGPVPAAPEEDRHQARYQRDRQLQAVPQERRIRSLRQCHRHSTDRRS